MLGLDEALQNGAPDAASRRIGPDELRVFLLQVRQFPNQGIVFRVRKQGLVLLVIEARVISGLFVQLFHPSFRIRLKGHAQPPVKSQQKAPKFG